MTLRAAPPGTLRAARRRHRRERRRRALAAVVLVVAVLLALACVSIGRALTAPGTDPAAARLAEWARGHRFGGAVTGLEKLRYAANPPQVGGHPAPGPAAGTAVAHLAPVPAAATPALPGEGVWRQVAAVHGAPAAWVTTVRPDATHTSYLTGLLRLDPAVLSFALHPGTAVPGGSGWSQPPLVPSALRAGLVATFNSGFTLPDSRGGYQQDGRTVTPLRAGAATLLLTGDGRLQLGAWGRDVGPGPTVAAVRQNLDLMIDGGRIAPDISSTSSAAWGATVGNRAYVWRSGVGVTGSGALLYAAGDALSTDSLAQLLQRAGAVRAMELDINRDWVSGQWYEQAGGVTVPHKLTPDESRPADRYFAISSRDFLAAVARPG
jgi:hypothetical protein